MYVKMIEKYSMEWFLGIALISKIWERAKAFYIFQNFHKNILTVHL